MSDIKDKAVKGDVFYYFAYGSNMLDERMLLMNKTAKYFGNGELLGYKLAFYDHSETWHGATASIEESPNTKIYGCIYVVSRKEEGILDQQEKGYHRITVPIRNIKTKEVLYCRSYQLSNPNKKENLPSSAYKFVFTTGAIKHKLPDKYIDYLLDIRDNGELDKINVPLKCLIDVQFP
uniref:gamma-glutamylcyclotransferase n=1 Tax=Strongyloides venezuelensis TaxID=75913 RepID=A0A0K0EXY8_STRVS